MEDKKRPSQILKDQIAAGMLTIKTDQVSDPNFDYKAGMALQAKLIQDHLNRMDQGAIQDKPCHPPDSGFSFDLGDGLKVETYPLKISIDPEWLNEFVRVKIENYFEHHVYTENDYLKKRS